MRRFLVLVITTFGLSAANADERIAIKSTSYQNFYLPGLYLPGTRVELQRLPGGANDGPHTFQWFHNEVPIPGATQSGFTLQSSTALDSGNYTLRVTGASATETSDSITLNFLPLPPNPVDRSFSAAALRDIDGSDLEYKQLIHVYDDGRVIALAQNVASGTNTWVRLLSNGQRDTSFRYTPATPGTYVLEGFANGGLIVSEPSYVLNPDGTPLGSFVPPAFLTSSDPGRLSSVVLSDGRFLLGRGSHLARFTTDGRLDPTFTFGAASDQINISSLARDASNRVYVSVSTDWSKPLVRLTETGALDPNFNYTPTGPYATAVTVRTMTDGRLLLELMHIRAARTLAMLHDDGTTDKSWTPFLPADGPIALYPDAPSIYDQGTWPGAPLHRYKVGTNSLVPDPSFYAGDATLSGFIATSDDKLIAVQSTGDGRHTIVRLLTNAAVTFPPTPFIYGDDSPRFGSPLSLRATTTPGAAPAATPLTYQWLALDGQPLPDNSVSPQLTISSFSMAHFGRYQLRVTSPAGSVLSNVLVIADQPPVLANLSGRAFTGTGENTMIAGFVVRPSSRSLPTSLLLRGAGPSLARFGVRQLAADPALIMPEVTGFTAANDDWRESETSAASQAVGAFPFDEGSKDAAMNIALAGGASTVLLTNSGADGAALLEVYNSDLRTGAGAADALRNLSLRAQTGPGERTAIAGFVLVDPVGGNRSGRVLLRAIGPGLAKSGITHPVENPVLTVYNSKGEIIAQNDDWPSHLTAELTEFDRASSLVGAFPLAYGSKDAAILLDLPAGAYSMHATGGTGVVLLEIYSVR